MARDYAAAIEALNSLQSNASIVEAIRKSGGAMNQNAIPEMIGWCRRLGYEPNDFNKLNIIHIAGTKGKGSTSAFISSILEQYISRCPPYDTESEQNTTPWPSAVGLYTSPHLRSVRERIRINGKPLSEVTFARFFFDTWDRLEASFEHEAPPTTLDVNPATEGATSTTSNPRPKPVYFRYVTLMALHTYLSLARPSPLSRSQTTSMALIFETGIGGTHDSTNIVPSPLVTAITPLALDHTNLLGNTVASIAHHKSGIFKPDSPHGTVYTSPQPAEAMKVLEQRAKDAGKELCVVGVHPNIASGRVKLGLEGGFQRINASLAVAVAAAWLRQRGCEDSSIPRPGCNDPLPDEFRRGLKNTKLGGRCEVRPDPVIGGGRLIWYLDGGHTVESVGLAGEWFASRAGGEPRARIQTRGPKENKKRRILLFNQQTRDAPALARSLHAVLSSSRSANSDPAKKEPLFTHAVFSTNITYAPSTSPSASSSTTTPQKTGYKPDLISINTAASTVSSLTVQTELASVWAALERDAGKGEPDVKVLGSIGEAVDVVRALATDGVGDGTDEETAVFVTGSLHLVGGVLEVLGAGDSESEGE